MRLADSLFALALVGQTPLDFTATRERGLELVMNGKPAEALAVFESAVKAAPDSAEAHLELANTHVAVADAAPADGDRQKALHHLQEAEAHYRRARALSPALADVVSLHLLTVYDRDHLNRPRDAEPHVRAMLAKAPGSPLYHVLLARTLIDRLQTAAAAEVLVNARTQVEADSRLFLAVTSTEVVLNAPTMARGAQRRVLQGVVAMADEEIARKTPEVRDAFRVKAAALLLQVERTATTDGERATLKAQADAAFDAFRALAPAQSPERAATSAAVKAEQARDADIRKATDLIGTHLEAGRAAEADRALAAAVGTFGKDATFWSALASTYVGAGTLARAVDAVRRAAELEPRNPERHHAVATYHWEIAYRDKTLTDAAKRGHIDAGLAAADKALALKPDYAEAVIYRGILLSLQATMESDPVRKQALEREAAAAKQQGQALMAERNKD